MGKLKRDDDYEYGYDHLHEQKRPADSIEDDEEPVDDEEQGETEFEIGQSDARYKKARREFCMEWGYKRR